MAKPTFAKLGLKKSDEVKTITINEQEIEVKQYLPVNEKLELISNVINNSLAEDSAFTNPVKVEIFGALEMIYFYTNISFTDKQKEDPAKLYDLLEQNFLFNEIFSAIPLSEYDFIMDSIDRTIESVYKYQNSALGIMERISADYSNLDLDAAAIQEKLADGENVEFLKEVLEKLG